MTANFLTLYSSNNEFLLVGLLQKVVKIHNSSPSTCHCAHNLDYILDEYLTFSDQKYALSAFFFPHIYQLRCINPIIMWRFFYFSFFKQCHVKGYITE